MFCLYLLLKASRKNKYNVTFNSKLSVKVCVVSDCGSLTRVVGFLQDTIINVPLVGGVIGVPRMRGRHKSSL